MKLVLGDNQFSGINHGDHLKAVAQRKSFEADQSVIGFIEQTLSLGVNGFSFSTTPRLNKIVNNVVKRNPDIDLYPAIPYAHTYADALNRGGPLGAAFKISNGRLPSIKDISKIIIRRDLTPLFEMLLRTELYEVPIGNLKIIFLNNIFTDLLVAWGDNRLAEAYCASVRKNFPHAKAGFMTMNLAKTVSLINQTSETPVICSIINPLGFRMNPSQKTVEDAVRWTNCEMWAMSPFASGANTAQQFCNYLNENDLSFEGVIFGSSKLSRVENFLNEVEKDAIK